MIVSCGQSVQRQVVFHRNIISNDTLNYDSTAIDRTTNFFFKNLSTNTPATFWFYSQSGINYHSAATILSSVLLPQMSDEEKALAIWRVTATSGHHYEYDYDHNLKDHVDPISLVTFPYFMCGEKAGIMANLAIIAGFMARNVSLKGHEVAEVWYNNSWHMFDADENCIFRNKTNQIASVEDLHLHPDLISARYINCLLTNDFPGFKRYKEYVSDYQSGWINANSLIENYPFPTDAITLYPGDEVCFQLHPNPWWIQLKFPRYVHGTKGMLKRKIGLQQSNVIVTDTNTILLNEKFPYYLTSLRVNSSELQNVRVYLQCQNRETLVTEKKYLGNLNQPHELVRNFYAPVKPDIYYSYSVIFENLSVAKVNRITIEHEFEFNALTFPLHRYGGKCIVTDTIGRKDILYQITQEH